MVFLVNTAISLLVALVLTGLLLALKIPVYIVLAVTFMVFSALTGGFMFTVRALFSTVSSTETWFLVVSVAFIAWLAILYKNSGVAFILGNEISKALRSGVLAITIPPGILGLLPIPGGALMSAPIVDTVGSFSGISREIKVFANVWYRHVTVFVYPLASMLIITSTLSGYSISELVMSLIPISLIMFIIGLPLVWNRFKVQGNVDITVLFKSLTPILMAAVIVVALSPLDTQYPRLSTLISAILALVAFSALNSTSKRELLTSILDRKVWEISAVAFEAVAFRTLLKLLDVSDLASTLGSSVVAICVVLPALLSLISGYPSAGVVISLPIATRTIGVSLQVASLIYISAYLAYLVSPVHLCLIYTVQYFKERILSAYKLLLPLTLGVLVVAYTWYTIIVS